MFMIRETTMSISIISLPTRVEVPAYGEPVSRFRNHSFLGIETFFQGAFSLDSVPLTPP